MISRERYITLSLELNLFWARIMKEHAIFLEAGFTPKNKELAKEADHYKLGFEKLLLDTVKLSNGNVMNTIIKSGEIVTDYTLEAEKKTKYYTGIDINSKITIMENELRCNVSDRIDTKCTKSIKSINCRAIKLVDGLIDFKKKVLDNVLCCELFTVNYPSLIEHTIREAKLYRSYINDLEEEKDITKENIRETQLFWDEIMREHALFIRGLLDPEENELIITSNKFAAEFSKLMEKTDSAIELTMDGITSDTISETTELRDFKKAAVEGISSCEIKSIILPLLSDHVLREANHYLRLLKECRGI